jgi:hypothetical protein
MKYDGDLKDMPDTSPKGSKNYGNWTISPIKYGLIYGGS